MHGSASHLLRRSPSPLESPVADQRLCKFVCRGKNHECYKRENSVAAKNYHRNQWNFCRTCHADRTTFEFLDVIGQTHGCLGENPDEFTRLECGDRIPERLRTCVAVNRNMFHGAHQRPGNFMFENWVLCHKPDEPSPTHVSGDATESKVQVARVIDSEQRSTLTGDVVSSHHIKGEIEALEKSLRGEDY